MSTGSTKIIKNEKNHPINVDKVTKKCCFFQFPYLFNKNNVKIKTEINSSIRGIADIANFQEFSEIFRND